MYSGIQKIEKVIDYIEENITSNLDCNVLAQQMNLSVYEFRRIFAFIVGCPISEYIRKRRLSLAACEILTSDNIDMTKLSEKYGYSTQSSFIKAFGEQHGVPPTAYLKENKEMTLFTRPKFELNISGREIITFKIIKTDSFYIKGFSGLSKMTDSCCCESVWNEFYENGIDGKLNCDEIYCAYVNKDDDVLCTIGAFSHENDPEFDTLSVPAARWACFKLNTVADEKVNEIYSKILYECLPSANLIRNSNIPTVEVFPADMENDGFIWEIRIPICD